MLFRSDIDNVLLVSPTTPDSRIQTIVEQARGFIYFVSLKGVTGAGHLDVNAVAEDCARVRRYWSQPLAVGFGIKDVPSATAIAAFADAVVVGSALVDRMGSIDPGVDSASAVSDAAGLIAQMRAGLDAPDKAE